MTVNIFYPFGKKLWLAAPHNERTNLPHGKRLRPVPQRKVTTMSHFHARSNHSCHSFDGASIRRIGSVCQYLLNIVAEAATRASERSRYAALPRRYLDDVGMTIAERDAALR
ncbi:MAG: hypothetical protein ABSC25_00915 [Roseiarcus sp.]